MIFQLQLSYCSDFFPIRLYVPGSAILALLKALAVTRLCSCTSRSTWSTSFSAFQLGNQFSCFLPSNTSMCKSPFSVRIASRFHSLRGLGTRAVHKVGRKIANIFPTKILHKPKLLAPPTDCKGETICAYTKSHIRSSPSGHLPPFDPKPIFAYKSTHPPFSAEVPRVPTYIDNASNRTRNSNRFHIRDLLPERVVATRRAIPSDEIHKGRIIKLHGEVISRKAVYREMAVLVDIPMFAAGSRVGTERVAADDLPGFVLHDEDSGRAAIELVSSWIEGAGPPGLETGESWCEGER